MSELYRTNKHRRLSAEEEGGGIQIIQNHSGIPLVGVWKRGQIGNKIALIRVGSGRGGITISWVKRSQDGHLLPSLDIFHSQNYIYNDSGVRDHPTFQRLERPRYTPEHP
jgi:hypothetical protein